VCQALQEGYWKNSLRRVCALEFYSAQCTEIPYDSQYLRYYGSILTTAGGCSNFRICFFVSSIVSYKKQAGVCHSSNVSFNVSPFD